MGKLIDNVKLFNMYHDSIIFEADCGNGMTRGAHRSAANKAFLRDLQSDQSFKNTTNDLFGYDVEQYMLSGKSGARNPLNPSPDCEWHHSAYVKGKIQLIPTNIHEETIMRSILHPGDNSSGGYKKFYGMSSKK